MKCKYNLCPYSYLRALYQYKYLEVNQMLNVTTFEEEEIRTQKKYIYRFAWFDINLHVLSYVTTLYMHLLRMYE